MMIAQALVCTMQMIAILFLWDSKYALDENGWRS